LSLSEASAHYASLKKQLPRAGTLRSLNRHGYLGAFVAMVLLIAALGG
jgi:hypothetical protein